jgi:hypothetical protein
MGKDKKKGTLVSRLDHPVYISYFGDGMTIAPRGTVPKIRKVGLGALPRGVVFVPNK